MKEYLDISLECNGKYLLLGLSKEGIKRDFGITSVKGLESSDLEVSRSDNALVDGSTVDGKRIKDRVIHIEATLRDDRNNEINRQRIIKFFNPKYTGRMTVDYSGIPRNIEYELEGWAFAAQSGLNEQLSIVVDLVCPDPYFRHIDNFGQNMANIRRQFAFPWRVVKEKVILVSPYKGMGLPGQISGYRNLKKEVLLINDGDVETGVQIQFIATRGPVLNPKITHIDSGKYVQVMTAMEKGDVLLVDTNDRHQVIELNGINIYNRINRRSQTFKLRVNNNYLEYDAEENYSNLDVKLYYTPYYLGV